MLGFGSISSSPVSALGASGNFGNQRTILNVVQTSYGIVLVSGTGSNIITIDSISSGAQTTVRLYATQEPSVYVAIDCNGNRSRVTIDADIYVEPMNKIRFRV